MANWSTERLPVSVSAANYSQLSDKELYARVNAPANTYPVAPPAAESSKPLIYSLVPGEIYPSDVPLETIYRELEISLEKRGYFNVVYQSRAGQAPAKIDYMLRVHYGERMWLTPIVRRDKVTWGNDGLVSNKHETNLISDLSYDPRIGLSPAEVMRLAALSASPVTTGVGDNTLAEKLSGGTSREFGTDTRVSRDFGQTGQPSQNFCLVEVEAFKFDDVRDMGKKAPCIWATFVAVPLDPGQKFSSVLRTLVQTATPYFGATTDGLQVYEVPLGRVFMGAPVEVPGPQKAPLPTGQTPP